MYVKAREGLALPAYLFQMALNLVNKNKEQWYRKQSYFKDC